MEDYHAQQLERHTPIVVMATGMGKSTVIAKLAADEFARGGRVLLLAHRRELLDQMLATIVAVAPGVVTAANMGVVQGVANQTDRAVVAATFQTLSRSPKRVDALGERTLVLVDEVHHSTAPSYIKVLEKLGVVDGRTKACGFTATATRADGTLGDVWDKVVFERGLMWAIDNGFLIKPHGLTVVHPDLELDKVKIVAGDYQARDLEKAMRASSESTVTAMMTHAADKRCIVFAAGVEHAYEITERLNEMEPHSALTVVGSMTRKEKDTVFDLFRRGSIKHMVTVQVLTEGADFPMCDCVVMARPTRSQVLYTQMVGRALRLHEDKESALVLDVAGTTQDMSLRTITCLVPSAEQQRVSPTSTDDPGQAPAPEPKVIRDRIGVVPMEETDLLATSPALWLTTKGGYRFLDLSDGCFVFVYPKAEDLTPGCAAKVGCTKVKVTAKHYWLLDKGIAPGNGTVEQAIEACELVAERWGGIPDRNAPWRQRPTPSEKQVNFALKLGVKDAKRMTKARLSDEISIALASRVIDPMVKAWEAQEGNTLP